MPDTIAHIPGPAGKLPRDTAISGRSWSHLSPTSTSSCASLLPPPSPTSPAVTASDEIPLKRSTQEHIRRGMRSSDCSSKRSNTVPELSFTVRERTPSAKRRKRLPHDAEKKDDAAWDATKDVPRTYACPRDLDRVLLPFQKEGIKFALQQRMRVLIGDDMGLGKTIQAIVAMYHYRDEWPLLVVVPSSVRFCWVDEMERWLASSCLSPYDISLIRSGTDVAALDKPVTVVTFGLLTQPCLQQRLMSQKYKCCIVDESHHLKNPKTKRTKALQPILKQARRVILLSGTPALARPEELYAQLDAVQPGTFGSFSAFAARYCNAHRTRFGWDTRGASNLPELHARLHSGVMIRRLKTQVLDQLPPKRRSCVALPPLSDAVLGEFRTRMRELATLGDDVAPFDRGCVLQELYTETGKAKINAVKEYIRGLCAAGSKFIVFAAHLDMLRGIQSGVEAEKTEYMLIEGATPAGERFQNVQRFQQDPTCKVAILSLLAASQGITLTAADTVVFAELHWTPGLMEQAENRAHRIGQRAAVNVHYLIARGTLDDTLWRVINRKVTVLSAALDGRRERLRVAGGYPGGKNADKRAGENQAPGSKVTGKNADRLHAMDGQESTCPGCADAMSLCSCEEVDGTASAPGSIVSDESADGNPCSAVDTVIAVVQATLPKTYDANDVRFFLTGAAAAQRRRSVPAVTTPPSSGKPPSGPSDSTGRDRGAGRDGGKVPWTCTACTFVNVPAVGAGTSQHLFCTMCTARRPKTKTTPAGDDVPDVIKINDDEAQDASVAMVTSATKPQQRVQFCVSVNTNRIFLHDMEGTPLRCAVALADALDDDFLPAQETPVDPHIRDNMAHIRRFANEYASLRPVDQRALGNRIVRSARAITASGVYGSIAASGPPRNITGFFTGHSTGHDTATTVPDAIGDARTGGSTTRYTTREVFVGGMQQEPTPDAKTPLSESRMSRCGTKHCRPIPVVDDGNTTPLGTARRIVTSPAGAAEGCGTDDNDDVAIVAQCPARDTPPRKRHPLHTPTTVVRCTYCRNPAPSVPIERLRTSGSGQKTTFCSHECWEAYSVRVGNDVRRRLLELEGGVCQSCRLDTKKLYTSMCAVESADDRRAILMKTPFRNLTPSRITKLLGRPTFGMFWQADHILAVADGGGECDLSNFRTLCTMCHEKVTAGQLQGAQLRKLKKAASGTKDIRSFLFGGSAKKKDAIAIL